MSDTNYKDYIDALSADTAPESTDLIYIRTSAGSRKMTVQNLFKAPSLMAVDWFRDGGDIGGYLMDGVDDYITVADDTKRPGFPTISPINPIFNSSSSNNLIPLL